jgi:nucleobase:cation symporter-1, NCS1 family
LSFGPYVADYSRYLPPSVSASRTFWYTGLGCFLGATLIMSFGVLLGFRYPALIADPGGAIAESFSRGRVWVRVLIIIGVLEGNVMNLYSAYMSSATIFSGLRHMQRIGRPLKFAVLTALIAIATLLSVMAQDDFARYFGDTLNAMIYLLVPWSAINLADYYLVRRGHYVIGDFFRRDGRYGAVNSRTIAVYLLGIAVQIPFMSLSFFQGPIAHALGADLAWLPGLVVPAALYVGLNARSRRQSVT